MSFSEQLCVGHCRDIPSIIEVVVEVDAYSVLLTIPDGFLLIASIAVFASHYASRLFFWEQLGHLSCLPKVQPSFFARVRVLLQDTVSRFSVFQEMQRPQTSHERP